MIGFDRFEKPANTELQPIPGELAGRLPKMTAMLKGFSDLQSNIDSKEAADVKQFLSTLPPEKYKAAIEEIGLAGNYIHGTHVAGIAHGRQPLRASRRGAHRVRLARCTPDPCPSRELVDLNAKNAQAYVDFFSATGCAW